MESQQIAKVRAEFDAARKEEPHGTGTIVKETIVRGTIGNISEFSMMEYWTRWFERLTHYFSVIICRKKKSIAFYYVNG